MCLFSKIEKVISHSTLPSTPLLQQISETMFHVAWTRNFSDCSQATTVCSYILCFPASYALCTVYTMHCIHYALYTLCTVYTMHCMHYALYALCIVCTMYCMHYALYALCSVYTMHCVHICTVCTMHCMHCIPYAVCYLQAWRGHFF